MGGVVGGTILLAIAVVINFLVRRNRQSALPEVASNGQVGEGHIVGRAISREPRMGGRLNGRLGATLDEPDGGRLETD